MNKDHEQFLAIEKHLPALAGDGWRGVLRRNLEAVLGLGRVRNLMVALDERVGEGEPVFEALLALNAVSINAEGVMGAIPPSGPVVVIANHPFGGADAAVMAALASRTRPDTRILANAELAEMPGMDAWLLPLQILGEPGAERANIATLRRALVHLQDGGLLVIFPAGAVAHWQWDSARVEDPPWPRHAARLIRKSLAPVLPVRFFGANPPWFHLMGALHPLLRSALIPRAFLSMRGGTVRCRAGGLLTPGELSSGPEDLTGALRRVVEEVPDGPGN